MDKPKPTGRWYDQPDGSFTYDIPLGYTYMTVSRNCVDAKYWNYHCAGRHDGSFTDPDAAKRAGEATFRNLIAETAELLGGYVTWGLGTRNVSRA